MSNSHSGTIGRRVSLTGGNPIRRQHSVEWNHERKRGHLYNNTSSSGGSSDDEGDRRLYGNTTGAVDNDFLANLIAQTQQLTSEYSEREGWVIKRIETGVGGCYLRIQLKQQ